MSSTKRKSAARSTLGLIASGVGTIGIGQRMPAYRFRSNGGALAHDRDAIADDARRAFNVDREYA